MKLVNIGFGNTVAADKIVAIVSPDSAPIKRMVQDAKDNGTAMDTYAFARNLARYLGAAPYNIPIKTINRGLGRCLVIIGEK